MEASPKPAEEADGKYAFEPFLLDTASRRLSRSGQPVALAPKTFDLLLLLVESQGRVLTKAQIMAGLWQDTYVEEGNLTFQISTLRKALGEEGAAWIETVPKVGYRFTGPVQREIQTVSQPEVAPMPPAPVPPRPRRLWAWFAAAGALALLALALAIRWSPDRETASTAPLEPVPLTSYDGVEREPSFSPDGSQVAFVWNGEKQDNFDIYAKAVGSGTPLPLTNDPAIDCRPAWSPDGRHIAFQRDGQGIYLVPPTGGRERKLLSELTACDQLSWSADGKHLAFSRPTTGGEIGGIFLITVENGAIRRLTRAEEPVAPLGPARRGWTHRVAAFSPDSRSLAFVSGKGIGSDILMLTLDAGLNVSGPARLVASRPEAVTTMAWTQDGRALVIATHLQSNRRSSKLSIQPGTEPEFLSFAGLDSETPAVSRIHNRMAYSRLQQNKDVWRLENNNTLTKSPLSSTLQDGIVRFSPDGRKVVFSSGRSGTNEIWIANADGTGEMLLTKSRGSSPRWSPDGRRIVYDAPDRQGRWDVNVVDAAGGPPIAVVSDPADDDGPSYSRDGRWIYFHSNRDARDDIYRVPARGGKPVRVTDNGGIFSLESADGKSIYYAKSNGCGVPLFVRSLEGGRERKVLDSVCARGFQVTERGIYYRDSQTDRTLLRRADINMPFWINIYYGYLSQPDRTVTVRLFDPESGQSREVRKVKTPIYDNGHLGVSPDGGTILVSGSAQPPGSDLYLVENFR